MNIEDKINLEIKQYKKFMKTLRPITKSEIDFMLYLPETYKNNSYKQR